MSAAPQPARRDGFMRERETMADVRAAEAAFHAGATADLAAGDILGARLCEALERLLRACVADRRIRT